eukprot:CAMPEP_0169074566 /NCGR_PEP_ID=MMETSP1015-20121227/7355_1 /TAXON_ID=342587 /ORGANISM="Karlodinium micrum, Strain CCMP2283" /LENGTH=332 /DNA_ID=CAMNT_0009133915 /DNA_START=17 /DNA_END=1015 /DNA_ORIENTATION=-
MVDGSPSSSYHGPPVPQTNGETLVWPENWGISRQQLKSLIDECRERPDWNEECNVREFVEDIVIPKTRGEGKGLALLLNQEAPLRVNTMISHCWEGNAGRFFDDVVGEMEEGEVAFICFLSLYQAEDGAGPYIVQQLGTDKFRENPFVRVLRHLSWYSLGLLRSMHILHHPSWPDYVLILNKSWFHHRMIVVGNEELKANGQGLYSRLWCVVEVFSALLYHIPIDFTQRTTQEHLFGSSLGSVRHARCGNPNADEVNKDELNIRMHIEGVNKFIEMFRLLVPIYVDQYARAFYDSYLLHDFDLHMADSYRIIDHVLQVLCPWCVEKKRPKLD